MSSVQELEDLLLKYSPGMRVDGMLCPFCRETRYGASIVIDDDGYRCTLCKTQGDLRTAQLLLEPKSIPITPKKEIVNADPVDFDIITERFFEFHGITPQFRKLYDIDSMKGIVYYPCTGNSVLSHEIKDNLTWHWINPRPEIFGIAQIQENCTELYITTDIFAVFDFRKKGHDAIAVLNYRNIADSIGLLPKAVKRYIFCLSEGHMDVLSYIFDEANDLSQEVFFVVLEGGVETIYTYTKYMRYLIVSESNHLAASKTMALFRKMIFNACAPIKQIVSDELNHLEITIQNRRHPVEESEAMLIDILLNNPGCINLLKKVQSLLHPDTNKIIDHVCVSLDDGESNRSVLDYQLNFHEDPCMRGRYKELKGLVDPECPIAQELLVPIMTNVVFYGVKQNLQDHVIPNNSTADKVFHGLETWLLEEAMRVTEIRSALTDDSFDASKWLTSGMSDFYAPEMDNDIKFLTGHKALDDNIPISPGTTTVLMGYSGDGKSMFLMNMIIELAKNNEGSIIWFDLEMTVPLLMKRIHACASGTADPLPDPGWCHNFPFLQKIKLFAGARGWDNDAEITVELLFQKIRMHLMFAEKHGIKVSVIVIDHVHQLKGAETEHSTGVVIDSISKKLPAMLRKYNVAVIAVGQMNKASGCVGNWEALMPSVTNMSYGGALKHAATSCIGVANLAYRFDERNNLGHIKKGFISGKPKVDYSSDKIHIMIDKAREDSKRGMVMAFDIDKQTGRIDFSNPKVVKASL